ncbi:hypothetical protein M8R19_27250 [Pseudomonas sp. R3.Fl]|uniref:hypothetical protein n=1 Tax=Pseudomonas TaxID=286 RepID=UPI00201DCD18|nr:hypothetical protein [Pseudomonas sp. R3.Fl]MCL6692390.1 hypothetical protein [Pseudomonas sp. R3.Fl]
MTDKSHTHDLIAWTKQQLDDLDTTIAEVEKATGKLKNNAYLEAIRALTRLKEARAKLREYTDDLRAEAGIAKLHAQEIQEAIEKEWAEAEAAFQSFLSSARDQADTVQRIISARAQAQRQYWEESTKKWRDQAAIAVEEARREFDAAIQQLSTETEKFQSRIGEVKDASDESWKAVKEGLSNTKDIHRRTTQKIKEAFSKLH